MRRKRTETTVETPAERKNYGLLAKFDTPEELVAAAKRVAAEGYTVFDAYSPYPIEELPHAMKLKSSPLPFVIFGGGLLGAIGGFAMQTYAQVIDYPYNIGGRPDFSWPAYIPISFELTILLAALAGILGLFFFARFPQPYHPVFNSEDFNAHGSQDAFYLDIESRDPRFSLGETTLFLRELGAVEVTEIEA